MIDIITRPFKTQAVTGEAARFMNMVYLWMTYGFAFTAAVSIVCYNSPALMYTLVSNQLLFVGLLVLQIIEVVAFAFLVKKIGAFGAVLLFFIYCATVGVTFSVIFLAYTLTSIFAVFLASAGVFAGLTLFGLVTKKDLSGIGKIAYMALLGLILVQLVGLFLVDFGTADILTAYAGLAIFIVLTAYDTQKIRQMNSIGNEGTNEDKVEAISGALNLYLDFINLFLDMLRIFGRDR